MPLVQGIPVELKVAAFAPNPSDSGGQLFLKHFSDSYGHADAGGDVEVYVHVMDALGYAVKRRVPTLVSFDLRRKIASRSESVDSKCTDVTTNFKYLVWDSSLCLRGSPAASGGDEGGWELLVSLVEVSSTEQTKREVAKGSIEISPSREPSAPLQRQDLVLSLKLTDVDAGGSDSVRIRIGLLLVPALYVGSKKASEAVKTFLNKSKRRVKRKSNQSELQDSDGNQVPVAAPSDSAGQASRPFSKSRVLAQRLLSECLAPDRQTVPYKSFVEFVRLNISDDAAEVVRRSIEEQEQEGSGLETLIRNCLAPDLHYPCLTRDGARRVILELCVSAENKTDRGDELHRSREGPRLATGNRVDSTALSIDDMIVSSGRMAAEVRESCGGARDKANSGRGDSEIHVSRSESLLTGRPNDMRARVAELRDALQQIQGEFGLAWSSLGMLPAAARDRGIASARVLIGQVRRHHGSTVFMETEKSCSELEERNQGQYKDLLGFMAELRKFEGRATKVLSLLESLSHRGGVADEVTENIEHYAQIEARANATAESVSEGVQGRGDAGPVDADHSTKRGRVDPYYSTVDSLCSALESRVPELEAVLQFELSCIGVEVSLQPDQQLWPFIKAVAFAHLLSLEGSPDLRAGHGTGEPRLRLFKEGCVALVCGLLQSLFGWNFSGALDTVTRAVDRGFEPLVLAAATFCNLGASSITPIELADWLRMTFIASPDLCHRSERIITDFDGVEEFIVQVSSKGASDEEIARLLDENPVLERALFNNGQTLLHISVAVRLFDSEYESSHCYLTVFSQRSQ
eukprot:gene2105-2509_t